MVVNLNKHTTLLKDVIYLQIKLRGKNDPELRPHIEKLTNVILLLQEIKTDLELGKECIIELDETKNQTEKSK